MISAILTSFFIANTPDPAGLVHMALSETECALTTFMDIIDILQKKSATYGFAPEALMLTNIGVALFEMSRDVDAFDSFCRAFQIQKNLLKDERCAPAVEQDLAKTLSNLGFVYARQGQYNDALDAFKENLSILQKYFPVDHPSICTAEENIAHVRAYGAVYVEKATTTQRQSNVLACKCVRPEPEESFARQESTLSACFQMQ